METTQCDLGPKTDSENETLVNRTSVTRSGNFVTEAWHSRARGILESSSSDVLFSTKEAETQNH